MTLWKTLQFSHRVDRLTRVAQWSERSLARLQERRLRRLVQFAAARSPFYRRKYHGLNLARVALEDLPTVTKDELRDHLDEVFTDPRVRRTELERFVSDSGNLGRWHLGRYAVSHTSGSQGAPLPIVLDRKCMELSFALVSARANALGKASPIEALRRLRHPARVAIVAARRGFYPSAAMFEFMKEVVGPYSNPAWFSSMQPDLVERLNDFQPQILIGYASVLEALAIGAPELRLESLKQIANSSEQLTARARQRIEQRFNVPLLDHYGIGECLLLSEGCPTDGGAHINADWAILEVVDDHNRPTPMGEFGRKVIITNLANRVQPFIRYEVGDAVRMATEPCRCGSNLPRIAEIEGRSAEAFWIRDGARFRLLSGVFFHHALDSLGTVREFRAVQRERNSIAIDVLPLGDAPDLREGIHARLREHLVDLALTEPLTFDVRIVQDLPSDPRTDKFRRMVSQVGPPV